MVNDVAKDTITSLFKPIINPIFGCYLLLVCIVFCVPVTVFALDSWHPLAPGIEYQDMEGGLITPWSHVHAFKVDLKQNQLSVVTARDISLKNAQAVVFARHSKALISTNGGFFDERFNPLGLRISEGRLISPLKHISWWGVFYIADGKARITRASHFQPSKAVQFAIQSGPRLLIHGRIPSLKIGSADRTALGTRADGSIILLVTTNAAMTTHELARLMQAPPLSCVDAINLDGGSSSQVFAHIGSFYLNVHGFSNVSDAIIVRPL
jgi:uncharacterized protein YigE (DUF2233 family)